MALSLGAPSRRILFVLCLGAGSLAARPAAALPGAPAAEPSPQQEPTAPQIAAGKIYLEKGEGLYQVGKYDAAWVEFTTAYQIMPTPDVVLALAQCEQKMGRTQEAIKHYNEFLEKAPKDSRAAVTRKQLDKLEGKPEPVAPPPPPPPPVAPPPPPQTHSAGSGRPFPVATTVLGITTLALGVAGAATLGYVSSQYSSLEMRCRPMLCAATEVDPLRNTATVGYALLGVAGVAAVATLIALPIELRRRRAERPMPVVLRLGPGSLQAAWRY